MYAIVRSGGKQYRVEEGRSVRVERLPGEEGAQVELGDVLLIANDDDVTVGTPTIEGARVLAEVENQGRHKKIIVFKYKSKVRTRKKTGHRQAFTQLSVQEILAPGQESKAAKPKRTRKAKAADEVEAPEAKAEVKEKPKPKAKRVTAGTAEKAPPKPRTRKTAAKAADDKKPAAKSTRARKSTAKTAEAKADADEKPKPRSKRAKKPSSEDEE